VIFVDDNSEDQSLVIAKKVLKFIKFNHKILSQSSDIHGKKGALTLGIDNAIHPWIITTDADCTVMPLWLKLFDQKIEEVDVKMIAGPVNFTSDETGFIDAFQKLDLAALIGTAIGSFGIGSPIVSNGANLLFSRDAFYEVSGYDGNIEIASGDDMFLMEKFKEKYPNKLRYLKAYGAIVYTFSIKEFDKFINQRLRWSAKSSSYGSTYIKLAGMAVGVANLSLIVLFFLAIFGISLQNVLPIIFLKLLVNFWLIKISSNFLRDNKKLYYYPIMSVVYPFYVLAIAVASQFITFEWKGRRFEK
ncbi:MAG: glycosyltransferase, partial [Flavobacteriales bacterium]|nr:glycosyltransferase [Flavobacteriales bacterium]